MRCDATCVRALFLIVSDTFVETHLCCLQSKHHSVEPCPPAFHGKAYDPHPTFPLYKIVFAAKYSWVAISHLIRSTTCATSHSLRHEYSEVDDTKNQVKRPQIYSPQPDYYTNDCPTVTPSTANRARIQVSLQCSILTATSSKNGRPISIHDGDVGLEVGSNIIL
jgi:hypothetical protein